MLFLSYLYDLSERDTERFVNDSYLARCFLDLAADQKLPDHSLLTTFETRLLKNGVCKEMEATPDGVLPIG